MTDQTYPWEPAYGFTETDPVKLAAALELVRRRICAYGPLATTCDCKYGLGKYILPKGDPGYVNSEETGCPELRSVIQLLLHGADSVSAASLAERLTRGNES